MPARYQVKFYGFTSEDARAFCRDLARVLKITEEQAWDFLMDAPLVIKDRLNKAEGQRLTDSLVSISALCLMELMPDATEEEEEEVEPPPPVPEGVESVPERVKRDQWGFRIWSAVLVGIAATLLIFGAVTYLVSYKNLYRGGKPAAKQPGEVTTKAAAPEPGPERSETRNSLLDRIEALQEQLKDLRARMADLERDINATAGAWGSDPDEVRRKQQTLQAQRAEMTAILAELRSARQNLDEMESEK
ncbi:MAG: hypothetical protein HY913_02180 [Desulfomonile tiedjei]|nr:hypothetical protein [Desulfomonile tiedjei]